MVGARVTNGVEIPATGVVGSPPARPELALEQTTEREPSHRRHVDPHTNTGTGLLELKSKRGVLLLYRLGPA